jgi:hypothetical protein
MTITMNKLKAPLVSLAATCAILLMPPALAGQAATLKPNRVKIAYVAPTNDEHKPIYEIVTKRRVLERFRDYLKPLRLPGPLLLKIEGCDGVSNAWFEEEDRAVTVCYEYLAEILANAPKETTPAGVTAQDALVGPAVEVFLHEIAHATFSMLKVPILGREEDAADQVAAYLLLQLDKEEARRTVAGVAYMYGTEMLSQNPGLKEFADVHGLSAQRFYNLLCMAYGADSDRFGDVVQEGYLPESRAEVCEDEYKQVDHAMRRLITPYLDPAIRKQAPKKWLRPAN